MSNARQLATIARTGIATVDTVADLRALNREIYPECVQTLGATAFGDGGGGTFYWDATSVLDDNTATAVLPTGHTGPGRWIRDVQRSISVLCFGVVGDGVTDDTVIFQQAIQYCAENQYELLIDVHLQVRVTSQIILYTGTNLVIDGKVLRDWESISLDKGAAATFKNENAVNYFDVSANHPAITEPVVWDTDITITGHGEIALEPALQQKMEALAIDPADWRRKPRDTICGPHLYLFGVINYQEGPITLRGPVNDWITCYYVFDSSMEGIKIYGQRAVFEDGFHIWGGKNITARCGYVEAGDDAFAISNGFNLPANNIYLSGTGEADAGNLVRVEFASPLDGPAFSTPCGAFNIDVAGKEGRYKNGGVFIWDQGGVIESCQITAAMKTDDVADHIGTNPDSIWIIAHPNTKNLKLNVITGASRRSILRAENWHNGSITVKGPAPQQRVSGYGAVTLRDCDRVTVRFDQFDMESTALLSAVNSYDSTNIRVIGEVYNLAASQAVVFASGGSVDVRDVLFTGDTTSHIAVVDTTNCTVTYGGATEYVSDNQAVRFQNGATEETRFFGPPGLIRRTNFETVSGVLRSESGAVVEAFGEGNVADDIFTVAYTGNHTRFTLKNIGSGSLTLKSVGGNLSLPADVEVVRGQSIELYYDDLNSVWRVF